jgi:hypothetical protein
MSNTELLPSVSIAAFLNAREGIRQRLATIHALIEETDEVAQQAGFGRPLKDVAFERVGWCDPKHFVKPDGLDPLLHKLDVSGWKHLMNQTGLYSFFDRTARAEWRERVSKGDVPSLSVEAIAGVFGTLHQDRRMMMERGVVVVFKRLSWDYKTNLPVKFGKRMVLTNLLDYRGWVYTGPNASVHALDDLVRAFHWAEGTPEPDHRQPLWQSIHGGAGTYDLPYFTMTVYKKGTGHITFKKPDLVESLNKILAKHFADALPAPRKGKSGRG